VSNDLVQSDDQKNCERQPFTISLLLFVFPQSLWDYQRLCYNKICARWFLKKSSRVDAKHNHKDSDEFHNYIIHVTSTEFWVSFLTVETKEQWKQWTHTYSPNKPKKFKQTMSTCQKADTNCFLGQESSADGGIHATWDHNNIRSVLQNTKRTAQGWPFTTKGMECWHPVLCSSIKMCCYHSSTAGTFHLGV
jgi:hypothetical protein